MGRHIVKQPNGRYAIFSSIVDHFVAYDATPEEVFQYFMYEAVAESDRQTKRGIESADNFGDERFRRDIATVRSIHGDEAADECLRLLSEPASETTEQSAHPSKERGPSERITGE